MESLFNNGIIGTNSEKFYLGEVLHFHIAMVAVFQRNSCLRIRCVEYGVLDIDALGASYATSRLDIIILLLYYIGKV